MKAPFIGQPFSYRRNKNYYLRNGLSIFSLERTIHLSVVVSSREKQALTSYFGKISLRRNGCGWN